MNYCRGREREKEKYFVLSIPLYKPLMKYLTVEDAEHTLVEPLMMHPFSFRTDTHPFMYPSQSLLYELTESSITLAWTMYFKDGYD